MSIFWLLSIGKMFAQSLGLKKAKDSGREFWKSLQGADVHWARGMNAPFKCFASLQDKLLSDKQKMNLLQWEDMTEVISFDI